MAQNTNAFVPEVYSKMLLRESKQLTTFKNDFTNNNYEGEIRNFGDTVRISTPDASAIVIGSGVVPDTTAVFPSQIVLTIDQSKNFQFKFNDIEQAQSQFNQMEGYMSMANAKMLDEVSLQLQKAIIADTDVPTVGTSSSYFETTDDTITKFFNRIKRTLVQNKALSSQGFYTFSGNKEQPLQLEAGIAMPPALFEELLNSNKLSHPTVSGDDILYKGVAGTISGLKIYQDTNLELVDGYDEDNKKYVVIAGTKMGMTFAEQYNKVEKFRDPQTFADIGRALYLYGYKITNPKSLVVGYTQSTSS